MAEERFKMVAAVYLLLIQDEQILLLRRFNTGYADGNFSLIAGHVDGDEPLSAAVVREAAEEAGIIVAPAALRMVHVLHRFTPSGDWPSDERVEFFFATSCWEGTPRILEPEKCDMLDWFPIEQLPEQTLGYVRHIIDQIYRGEVYSEYGWL